MATDFRYAQLGAEVLFKRDFSKRENDKIEDAQCAFAKWWVENIDLHPLGLNYYCIIGNFDFSSF